MAAKPAAPKIGGTVAAGARPAEAEEPPPVGEETVSGVALGVEKLKLELVELDA